MSHTHSVLIVGEDFSALTNLDSRVITEKEAMLRLGDGVPLVARDGVVAICSGVEDEGGLEARLRRAGYNVRPARNGLAQAPREATHKHKQQNTLISVPVVQPDGAHRFEVHVPADSELTSDHRSIHLMGIVESESARQALLAWGYYNRGGSDDMYLFTQFNIKWSQMATWLPMWIDLYAREVEDVATKRRELAAIAKFYQLGSASPVAEASLVFTPMPRAKAVAVEVRKIRDLIDRLANAIAPSHALSNGAD